MACMVPIVASRRNCRKSSSGAVIAGMLIFLVFGIFFAVFFNRSGIFGFSFPVIFVILGFVVFIMIISGISMAASSMSKSYKPPIIKTHMQNQTIYQRQKVQQNPYIVRKPIQKSPEPLYQENPSEAFPIVNDINFCCYCGAKVDRKGRFCHQCGSKL